jgi:two-component system NtrC family response regulator
MKKKLKILLIDDDISLCRVLEHQLTEEGFDVTTAHNGKEGLVHFRKSRFEIVITDLAMPDIRGIDVLKDIRSKDTHVVVILITAFGTIENAVEACHLGADDYITKPFNIEQLRFVIEKAYKYRLLEKENLSLKAQIDAAYGLKNIVGQSAGLQEVYHLIRKVAPADTTVLIQGESGTGKELVARAIHALGQRNKHPFIPVDCAAIPDTLLESEFFGHVKGSFTGAIKDRKGKFESANGGTLFLDEIGELKERLQSKLLRTLQERQIQKVGADKFISVDVRIIAASNRDLVEAVQENTFRQDLYYRLAVVTIEIPPLRERREDIPGLVKHFINKHGKNKNISIDNKAEKVLIGYNWPGNVRELENVIERALVISDNDKIEIKDLPEIIKIKNNSSVQNTDQTLEEIEKNAIMDALKKAGMNRTGAARILGIPRHVLLYRMKKWRIE